MKYVSQRHALALHIRTTISIYSPIICLYHTHDEVTDVRLEEISYLMLGMPFR